MRVSTKQGFQCVKCTSALEVSFQGDGVTCNCGQHYPVIGGIPVLVSRVKEFIAEAYFLYYHNILSLDYQSNVVTDNFATVPLRQGLRKSYVEALRHNRSVVERLINVLEPHTSIREVLRVKTNPSNETSRYLKDFDYLRRDWAGHPEGEDQLKIIHDALAASIGNFALDRDNVLVLGAGTGRIAHDLKGVFKNVLATDLSFSMAFHYHAVMADGVTFYELNTHNLYHRDAYTRKIEARFHNKHDIQDTLVNYFISDVKQLPLQARTISCVVSVYFTDVLALKLWLGEIKRVLKPGGLFIHFGPLGYPFEDFREKLSAEEVMDVFKSNDFEILEDKLVPTGHLISTRTLLRTTFNNWFMVARYQPTTGKQSSLTSDAVPLLKHQVNFRLEGPLTNGKTANGNTIVTLYNNNGNQVTGSDFLMQLVNKIDNRKSIKEIIDLLSQQYEISVAEEENILGLFQRMVNENIVGVSS